MKITITQDDIDFSTKKDCYKCPAAKAIKRATGKEHGIDVDDPDCENQQVLLWETTNSAAGHGKAVEITKNEKKLIKFIRDYDAGKEVKPITFEIEDIK